MAPKKSVPPILALTLLVFAASFLLQFMVMDYLLTRANSHYQRDLRRLQIQITQDLAAQSARAQSSNDDLTTLAALRSARTHHPQIMDAMVFDNTGKISLHTDSGWMGKKINIPQGPRLMAPWISHTSLQGRRILSIQVPLPDRDDGYFRVNFDEARFAQESQLGFIQLLLLILTTSAGISFLLWVRLRRYAILDPHQRTPGMPAPLKTETIKVQHTIDLMLSEMPHAALAIDRDNQILGANTLALELLNCRQEELVNLHVLSAPLPATLTDFYSAAIKNPGQLSEAKLLLIPKTPAMRVRMIFSPADEAWELALVTLQ